MRLGPRGDDHGRVQDVRGAAAAAGGSAAAAADLLGSGESIGGSLFLAPCRRGLEEEQQSFFFLPLWDVDVGFLNFMLHFFVMQALCYSCVASLIVYCG